MAQSPAEVRQREIALCPAVPDTWGDGRDRPAPVSRLRFAYDEDGAPVDFPRAKMQAMIVAALQGWGDCGLQLEWLPAAGSEATHRIAWRHNDDGQTIGLADLGARRLWLSPKVFALLRGRNPQLMESTMQMTLSHEIGHFLGLVAHSRRCVDVTSYYSDRQGRRCDTAVAGGISGVPGRLEFRSELPTACDVARCRRANGANGTNNANSANSANGLAP